MSAIVSYIEHMTPKNAFSKKYFTVLIAWLAITATSNVASSSQNYRWKLGAFDFNSSVINIFKGNKLLRAYTIDCDASEATINSLDQEDAESNTIDIITLSEKSTALLIVNCRVGAHSRQLSVYNLATNHSEPVWLKTGSYFAEWKIKNNNLWLIYDRPCSSNSCVSPFKTEEEQWNPIK